MKGFIHYILVFTVIFSHWSFASANNSALEKDSQRSNQAQEIIEKSIAQNESSDSDVLINRSVIQMPGNPDRMIEVLTADGPDALIIEEAQKEIISEQKIPENDFIKSIVQYQNGQQFSSFKMDAEKWPNFNKDVIARVKQKKDEALQKEREESIARAADASMKKTSEVYQTWLTFSIRWGLSVYFFQTIVDPSNFELAVISGVSFINTMVLNNFMRGFEKSFQAIGRVGLEIPHQLMRGGAYLGDQFLNPKAREFLAWFPKKYKETILNNHYAKQTANLAGSFVLQSTFVAAYLIAMNLGSLGFESAIMESGGGSMAGVDVSQLPHDFSFARFKEALFSGYAQFSWAKAWDFIWMPENYLLEKTLVFTIFSRSWDVYRLRYREQVSNQTKANTFGRLMGVFFALMTPVIYIGEEVVRGASTNPLGYLGVVSIGTVGIMGMAFVYGDAPKYLEYINTQKQKLKDATATFRNYVGNHARAVVLGTKLGMANLSHMAGDLYTRTSRKNWGHVPEMAFQRIVDKPQASRCALSSL
ncbi:MAG: hypothetical protein VX642_08695 [Bdellovibrionota bacterium]|nr:hypothetical protein [Bdellovibrionota bacterium]